MPRPTRQDPPRAAASAPAAPPAALMEAVSRRIRHPQAFEATLLTHEWQGSRHHMMRARLLFRPPATALTYIEESNHLPAGFSVLSDGGPTVRLKLPGLLSFVKLNVSRRDPRARSLNGFYPDEVTPLAFAQWLKTPGARLSATGTAEVAGEALTLVRVEGLAFPAEMSRAEIGLSADGCIRLAQLYEQNTLRYECYLEAYTEREVSPGELTL